MLKVLIPEILIDFQMPKAGQIKPHDTQREFPDDRMETGMSENERLPKEKEIQSNSLYDFLIRVTQQFSLDFAFLLTRQIMGTETHLLMQICAGIHRQAHTHTYTQRQLLLPRPFTKPLQLPIFKMSIGTKKPAADCNFSHAYVITCKFQKCMFLKFVSLYFYLGQRIDSESGIWKSHFKILLFLVITSR